MESSPLSHHNETSTLQRARLQSPLRFPFLSFSPLLSALFLFSLLAPSCSAPVKSNEFLGQLIFEG